MKLARRLPSRPIVGDKPPLPVDWSAWIPLPLLNSPEADTNDDDDDEDRDEEEDELLPPGDMGRKLGELCKDPEDDEPLIDAEPIRRSSVCAKPGCSASMRPVTRSLKTDLLHTTAWV